MSRFVVAFLMLYGVLQAANPPGAALKDRWEKIGTPDFELYTNAGDTAAREALENLQQVRGFFLKASPLPLLDQFPVRIIVFKAPEQLEQYTLSAAQTAFFVSSARRDFIAMSDSPHQYREAIHEYMHLIVRHSGLRLPTWLNEGWSEVYSTLRPVDDGVAVGDLIDGRIHTLNFGKWLDIDTLTSIDPHSATYRGKGDDTEMFYAESWALAHMLFLAPDYTDSFPKFLIAIHQGKNFSDACEAAYGKSGAAVYADLLKYFQRRKMYGKVYKAPLGKKSPDLEISKVDPFDARLMLADLLAAIGRHAEARQEYAELGKMLPNRFEIAESLGYLASSERNSPLAREQFERAFAAGDADPRMCLQLAVLEREAKQPADRIVAPLERALQSKPGYTDALLELGLAHIAARDYESGVAALLKIDKVTPDRATPVYSALAYGYFETGDLARARRDAETAKRYAADAGEAQRLDGMLEMIEARAKSPFAPQPGEKPLRVEGALRQIDCSSGGNRLILTIGNRLMVFELPDSKAVEFIHASGPGTLSVACGPQKPVWLTVEYAASSVMDRAIAGVVRRIEY